MPDPGREPTPGPLARLRARIRGLVLSGTDITLQELRRDLEAVHGELRALAQRSEETARRQAEELDALARHLPPVLNAIASQNAVARAARRAELRVEAQLAELEVAQAQNREHIDIIAAAIGDRIARIEERGEFIRRELFYELRYRSDVAAPEAKVLAPDRVAAAGSELRLNLGCGHLPDPDYVNVDARDLDGVDVLADVRNLPFDPGSVAEMRAAHLLEHFPEEELRRRVLPHWRDLLREDGSIVLIVPDAGAMLEAHAAGTLDFDALRRVTFGDQEYDGDFHFTMFDFEHLRGLLEDTGFGDVQLAASARPNGDCLEMEVRARPRPRTPVHA
jgi:SAM-dependent methyltransferase